MTVSNAGTFRVTAGSKRVGSIDGTGVTSVTAGASLSTAYVRQGTLTIADGVVSVRPDGTAAGASEISALTITGTGRLGPVGQRDDDRLRDPYVCAPPIPPRPTGSPPPPPPTPPTASATSDHRHHSSPSTLTLAGDANLDGLITPDDYALLDRGFATTSDAHWPTATSTTTALVDQNDYLLIDTTLRPSPRLQPRLPRPARIPVRPRLRLHPPRLRPGAEPGRVGGDARHREPATAARVTR